LRREKPLQSVRGGWIGEFQLRRTPFANRLGEPLRSEKSVQPVRSEKSVQSLRRQESLQPVRGG
jgi:hypothetical protein